MRTSLLSLLMLLFISCTSKNTNPLIGTWQLISGTLIEKGDTIVTTYNKDVSFIKIINETHFSFLQHDLNKGKDSTAIFVSGGGRYSLHNNSYTEYLEYCSDRNWEGNTFNFTFYIKADTLTISGVEDVENLGIKRLNIEKYAKLSR